MKRKKSSIVIKMAVNEIKEIALCHVIKNGSTLLLIKAEEGLNKGKWNAPNGEIQKGETPVKSAMRQVFQQTGLYVSKAAYHGTIRLFLDGKNECSYRLHVFSTRVFSGDLKPNLKGEAKWFDSVDIPYYEMWADDKYWTNLVLQGKEFDADFFFDEKNETIAKYLIKEKQNVAQKIIMPIILIAVIAVVAFGGLSLYGGLSKKTSSANTSTVKPAAFVPNAPTTTAATTTIPVPHTTSTIVPPPIPIITVDNIDLTYNYTGPSQDNGQYCNTPTKTVALYTKRTYTGDEQFYFNTTITTDACNYTISRIYSTTPGFTISQIMPQLPQTVPPGSTSYMEVVITAPDTTFTGPLSLVIDAN